MPLSDEEERILQEIEDQLHREPRPYGRPPMRVPPPPDRVRRAQRRENAAWAGVIAVWTIGLLIALAIYGGAAILIWRAVLHK